MKIKPCSQIYDPGGRLAIVAPGYRSMIIEWASPPEIIQPSIRHEISVNTGDSRAQLEPRVNTSINQSTDRLID